MDKGNVEAVAVWYSGKPLGIAPRIPIELTKAGSWLGIRFSDFPEAAKAEIIAAGLEKVIETDPEWISLPVPRVLGESGKMTRQYTHELAEAARQVADRVIARLMAGDARMVTRVRQPADLEFTAVWSVAQIAYQRQGSAMTKKDYLSRWQSYTRTEQLRLLAKPAVAAQYQALVAAKAVQTEGEEVDF